MGASHSVRAASWLPWALALGLGLAGIALTGCGLPKRPDLLMPGFETLEPLVGFESVRAVAGYPSVEFQREFDVSMATFARRPVPLDGKRDFDILVLSSGGVNGSFGAGALTAWTELGERPDFELVTGVSIGAILAPFAFAGPDFDDRLVELFRYVERDDVMEEKTLLTAMIWDESVMSSEPLCERIELGVDEALMEAMAARHRAGARCYVGTTNLDRGQFVVWDLGAIAVHESEQALALLRKVLLASCSIPVVYPPVRFELAAGDEMHVDGAVSRTMFVPQGIFDVHLAIESVGLDWTDLDTTMYVIHNGCLRIEPEVVQRETLAIAARSILLTTYTAVTSHVLQLYLVSQLFGAEFRFLTIPDGQELMFYSFTREDAEQLFLLGRAQMEGAAKWSEVPPGYVVDENVMRLTKGRSSLGITPKGVTEPSRP